MLSNTDLEDVMQQFQRDIPVEQIAREFGIANPPMLEQCCSDLAEQDQIPMLKTLVRMEAERIAIVGIETFEGLTRFLDILECLRKNGWIDDSELQVVLFEVGRWVEGERNGKGCEMWEAEAALQRIAGGLSHRMF